MNSGPDRSTDAVDLVGAETSKLPWRRHPAAVMTALFVVMVFNYMDRAVMTVLLEPIGRDLGLADSALGLLAGLPFAVLYALIGLPFARVADVANRKILIATAVAVWSVATVACGMATGFASLFLMRVMVGVGEGVGTPATHSAMSDNVPVTLRSMAAGLFVVAATLGALLGYVLGGVLSEYFGWRVAFAVVGAPGLLVALLVLWLVPETRPAPRLPRLAEVFGSEARYVIGRLWRLPTFKFLVAGFTLSYFVQMGIAQWTPVFVSRQIGLSGAEIGVGIGVMSSVPMAVAGVIGGMIGGALAKRNIAWLLRLPGVACLLLFPACISFVLAPNWDQMLWATAAIYFLSGIYMGPLFAAIYSIARSDNRATVVALVAIFTNIIGAGLGPFVIGLTSDLLVPIYGADSLKYALAGVATLLLPAALFFILAAPKLAADSQHN